MEFAAEPMAADWLCTHKQVDDRALKGKSHEREILEAILPLNITNLSRLAPEVIHMETSSQKTLTNECFGSPAWVSEETQLPDSSESMSSLGLTSWTPTSFHAGEELGVRRQIGNGKGDLATGHAVGPLANSRAATAGSLTLDDASPANSRAGTAGSLRLTVAARRRAARMRLLAADGAFIGEHAGGFCSSDCLRCHPRKPAERSSE